MFEFSLHAEHRKECIFVPCAFVFMFCQKNDTFVFLYPIPALSAAVVPEVLRRASQTRTRTRTQNRDEDVADSGDLGPHLGRSCVDR